MRSIRARLIKGIGANAFGQTVVVAVQLVGVPILLSNWGAHLYGEWLILFAIPAYLSLLDLGFSQSAANDMTALVAQGERKKAVSVLHSLSALVLIATTTGFLLSTISAFVLIPESVLRLQEIQSTETRWVLWLLALEILVKVAQSPSYAGFRANGDYPLAATLYSCTTLAQHSAIWGVAILGYGVVSAAAVFVLVRLGSALIEFQMLRRRHSWIEFGIRYGSRSELRRLFKPALANLGMPLAGVLGNQSVVLVIGACLNPVAVVTFSILRTLTRFLVLIVLGISNAFEPDYAVAYGSRNSELLRKLYSHALRAAIWLVLIGSLVLYLAGAWILSSWTNDRVAMDSPLFHWLLLTAAASVLWHSALTLLKASNRHLAAAIFYILTTLGALLLSSVLLLLTQQLWTIGPSLFVMDLVFAGYVVRLASKTCGIRDFTFYTYTLNPGPLLRLLAAQLRSR